VSDVEGIEEGQGQKHGDSEKWEQENVYRDGEMIARQQVGVNGVDDFVNRPA
jgi:hypothetical protein